MKARVRGWLCLPWQATGVIGPVVPGGRFCPKCGHWALADLRNIRERQSQGGILVGTLLILLSFKQLGRSRNKEVEVAGHSGVNAK